MNVAGILATWPGRIGVLVLVAAIGGGGIMIARGNTAAPKADLRTATVARGSVSQTVTVSGSINAQGQARLAFKSGGKIAQIYVTSGQTVSLGQPLAKLDTTDLETAVATAQQNLANAQASYQKQLLSAQDAQKNLAQARQSAANDVASAQATLTKLKSSYAAAKTNFASFTDSATGGIANFQNSLDTIQSQIDALIAEMRLVVGGGDTGDLRNALNAITGANSPALQNARSNSVTLLSPAVADYQSSKAAVLSGIADYDAAYAAGNDTSNMASGFQLTQTNYAISASRVSSALDTTSGVLGTVLSAVTSAQSSLNTQSTRDLHSPFDRWRTDLASLFNYVSGQQQSVSTLKLKLSQATSYLTTMNEAVGGSIATAAQNIVTTQQRGQQSIDNATSAVANVPLNLQSAQVSVDNANSAVATATSNLDSAVLTAPAAGIVASIDHGVLRIVGKRVEDICCEKEPAFGGKPVRRQHEQRVHRAHEHPIPRAARDHRRVGCRQAQAGAGREPDGRRAHRSEDDRARGVARSGRDDPVRRAGLRHRHRGGRARQRHQGRHERIGVGDPREQAERPHRAEHHDPHPEWPARRAGVEGWRDRRHHSDLRPCERHGHRGRERPRRG